MGRHKRVIDLTQIGQTPADSAPIGRVLVDLTHLGSSVAPAGSANLPVPAAEPNLRCPYTGELFNVIPLPMKSLGRGVSGWTTDCKFNPAAWRDSKGKLESSLRMRDGVLAPGAPRLVCAYTGRPITIVWSPDTKRYRAEGAYSPRCIYTEKSELLYDVSIRKGVLPAFPRVHKIEVRVVEAPPANPMADVVAGGKETQKLAEQVVEEVLSEKHA